MPAPQLEELLDQPFLEIARKLTAVDKIPNYSELISLVDHFKGITKLGYKYYWNGFTRDFQIYEAFCREYVESLGEAILNTGLRLPVLEIGAGNGKLSYWLNHFGVPTVATDSYTWQTVKHDEKYVEKMDHIAALEKYAPELVLCSWPPPNEPLDSDAIDFPSVKSLVIIGEWGGYASGTTAFWDRTDLIFNPLDQVEKFSLYNYEIDSLMFNSSSTVLVTKS